MHITETDGGIPFYEKMGGHFHNGIPARRIDVYKRQGTTRNFNHVMALAADTVIAEADYIVECGQIAPENVVTPGILVDYVVQKRRRTL